MASNLFHNNTVSQYDVWYESHAALLRSVCLELGKPDEINDLMEKFLGAKLKMKFKKNSHLPKKPKSAYFFFCDEKRPALIEKAKKGNKKVVIGNIAKKLGEMWGKLNDKNKEKYNKLATGDKVRYEKEMEEFNQKYN